MTTLYQLHDDLVELENRLDEMKAEERQEEITLFINQWTQTEGNLHDKIDNYAALIQELESRAEMRKGEAKRLSDRAAVDLNKAKSLREGLLNLFEIREMKKLDTKRFHLTRRMAVRLL